MELLFLCTSSSLKVTYLPCPNSPQDFVKDEANSSVSLSDGIGRLQVTDLTFKMLYCQINQDGFF